MSAFVLTAAAAAWLIHQVTLHGTTPVIPLFCSKIIKVLLNSNVCFQTHFSRSELRVSFFLELEFCLMRADLPKSKSFKIGK